MHGADMCDSDVYDDVGGAAGCLKQPATGENFQRRKKANRQKTKKNVVYARTGKCRKGAVKPGVLKGLSQSNGKN